MDWKLTTDYLRCSPKFHGKEHHDYILIRTLDRNGANKHIFAQLLFMFKFRLGKHSLDLALVLPMDALNGNRRRLDQDLGFTRVHSHLLAESEFMPLESVIHGALLVPDFDSESRHDDFFVVDSIDHDMFLHVKQLDL
jgi:hypothetical protein